MHVLGETFVRIEGVKRALQKQQAGDTGAQSGRKRAAGPLETKQQRSARSYLSHVRSRTASDSMVPFGSYTGYLPANVSLSLQPVSDSSLSRNAVEQVVATTLHAISDSLIEKVTLEITRRCPVWALR